MEDENIQLGDIIQIEASTNPEINNIYYINYLDSKRLELINTENGQPLDLTIDEDGNLNDKSISGIILLDRPNEAGYARQHDLLPGKWVDIYFTGDVPEVVTGQITNLDEDMIEIKTWPDNIAIYIDFGYKGIPEDLPISQIVADRAPPTSTQKLKEVEPTSYATITVPGEEGTDVEEFMTIPEIETQLKEILIDADQIELGMELDVITQLVEVPEGEVRFSIDKQTTDLLDELLSSIPNRQRTQTVLNNLHTMVERFKQLRAIYSSFDEAGNAQIPQVKGANFKPLVKALKDFRQKLYWILPVAKYKKKVYDIDITDEFIDLIPMTLAQARIGEAQVMVTYLSNDIPEGQNKYDYLIKALNPYLTPYINPNLNDDNITEQRVNTNLASVIDNLEDMYSSVVQKDTIDRRRFVVQNYNVGLVNQNIQHALNDTLTLKSMLTLPESTVRFSHINLPASNIMLKSDLSLHYINYWQLLTKHTNANTIIVSDDEELPFEANTYLANIKNYLLDETIHDDDRYEKYLNSIIPKTRVLFELIKKYIIGKYSLYAVVGYLEPFLIYQHDISYKQYETINNFITEKIKDYKRRFVLKGREYAHLNIMRRPIDTAPNPIMKLLKNDTFWNKNNDLLTEILKTYDLENINETTSDIEVLSKMMRLDDMRLFSNTLAKIDTNLMTPGTLDIMLDIERHLKDKIEQDRENNDCKKYVLAKKYVALDELEDDNNNTIYFDKKYDNTFYDIINEYAIEKQNLTPPQFKDFLIQKLKDNIGLSQENAERDANAMLEGKREVLPGDLAVLELEENDDELKNILYFIRDDNKWVRDETISDTIFTQQNKAFCNLQPNCYATVDNCIETNSLTTKNQAQFLQEVMNEFDDFYNTSKENITADIDTSFAYYLSNTQRFKLLKNDILLMYNAKKNMIGAQVAEVNIIHSPYSSLRDIILGQADFVKRQNDIQRFVVQFTRKPLDDEDEHWLYCIQSDIKLIPQFLIKLAQVYTSGGDYFQMLEAICAHQGTISDDGDAWVDKHSGYIIRNIDFDTEEGYTEGGYKLKTREKMEQDLGSAIMQQTVEIPEFVDPEIDTISNVITTMAREMGISVPREFIINNTIATLRATMSTETDYEAYVERILANGKKRPPSYEMTYNSSLIIITLAYYLIGIQISVPSIRSRKTFPGCIRSFIGFPLTGIEDKSGLTYVGCVASKIGSSVSPWNSLKNLRQNSIIKRIEAIINKYIITNPVIQEKFIEKRAYLQIEKTEFIPIEHDIKMWINFLPPLTPFVIQNLNNITQPFKTELFADLRKGSKKQDNKILVIQSKIIYYSLSIQNMIQKIVEKEAPLLTNANQEPFLENTCCSDTQTNTLAYFKRHNKHIETVNSIVMELVNLLYDISHMAVAPILFDPRDTKILYPTLPTDFSEQTIYRAFIVYCKYNTNIPISEDLRTVCMEKPINFDVNASIDEKIKLLKWSGKHYANESLQQLMKVINKQNIVHLHLDDPNTTAIQALRDILEHLQNSASTTVPATFQELLTAVLNTFDISLLEDSAEMRDFKNYLASSNKHMASQITTFIQQNSTLTNMKFEVIERCIKNLLGFEEGGDGLFIAPEDESLYRGINFIKNSIRNIVNVYPNIIINNVDWKDVMPPRHWKLSERHKSDIYNITSKYYIPLAAFYNDPQIDIICRKFQILSKDIELLANNTFFLAPITRNNQKYHSIFDHRTCFLLFNYYIFSIFIDLISLYTDDESKVAAILGSPIEQKDEDFAGVSELDIIQGDKKKLIEKTANILVCFIQIICDNKKVINYSYQSIMSLVLKAKEKEKDIITDYLKELTDEEREIENIFKNNKLEQWGKGLQKGLTQYVREVYDEEREAMEKQAITEKKLGLNDQVTAMNRDIFALELDNDERTANEIDAEEYDITALGDDDDYGDLDGDEGFY